MRKIIGVILSVVLLFLLAIDDPSVLMASEREKSIVTVVEKCDNKYTEIKTNFDYNVSSDYTEMVVSENMKNDTGRIDSDFEEALNSAGLLDSDIESFTDDEIKNIENANEISVVTKYYEIDESNLKCKELDSEEIEEYYKEYYNKETDTTKGGKFRNTVVLCNTSSIDGRKAATFSYTIEWLEVPRYCLDDYFILELTGSVIKPGNRSFPLSYTINYKQDTFVYENGKNRRMLSKINCTETFDSSKFEYCCVDNKTSIAYHQDLPGVGNGIEVSKPVSFYPTVTYYEYHYYDIVMRMSGYVCMTDKSANQFDINAKYFHFKKNKSDLKIESTGVSILAVGNNIIDVFSSFISDEILDFNSNVYYSNPDYLKCSYLDGMMLL